MELKLVSHVNDDGDILEAWFRYYIGLGISSFHLIVHGRESENAKLHEIKDRFPIVIRDSYVGEFDSEEKKRRIDSILMPLVNQWVLVVDSDEFVEFPFGKIETTIRMLGFVGGNTLFAPMLQHLTTDGSLNSPEIVEDPFRTFPLCSIDLYEKTGTGGSINKFPLFYCAGGTKLADGGNHGPPLGVSTATRSFRGVTHHFKFRKPLFERMNKRIHSAHRWRHESERLLQYIGGHDNRLPLEGTFFYSREELFRRGLLRRFGFRSAVRWASGYF